MWFAKNNHDVARHHVETMVLTVLFQGTNHGVVAGHSRSLEATMRGRPRKIWLYNIKYWIRLTVVHGQPP